MSRYYDVRVGSYHWTSHPSGPSGPRDPGALQVEMDISATPGDATHGTGNLTVWGVGLDVISQVNNLANQPITVSAGMGAGLPLSDPSKAGQIAGGTVNKVYGTYEGVNQAVQFEITLGGSGQVTTPTPGPAPKVPPLNIVLNWKKGTPLSQALQQALQQGMPDFTPVMRISDSLVAPQDVTHASQSLYEFSGWLRELSRKVLGDDNAMGVSLAPNGNQIVADDGTQTQQAGQIALSDLIGMPTWIDINTIQVKMVMRGDMQPLTTITLPQGAFPTGQYSLGSQTNTLSFQGSFYVNTVRCVGNSRSPDAAGWVTVVEASSMSGAS